MIITEIKKVGRGDRYSLYVDEEFILALEAEILAKNKLKTGDEISYSKIEQLKLENGDFASFDRGLSILEKGMKTEKSVRDYLYSKGYLKPSIDKAIIKLKEYGYIDDEVYTESYIKTYSGIKGKKKIKFELVTKGVNKEIIDEKLDLLVDEDNEFETCKKLCKKYLKNKIIDQKTRQKVSSHLVSKRFGFDVISKVVRECLSEVEDESGN